MSGTVAGDSLTVKDAIFGVFNGNDGNGHTGSELVFYIVDHADYCTALIAGTQPNTLTTLGASMLANDASTGAFLPPTTGRFGIGTDLVVPDSGTIYGGGALFLKTDSNCAQTIDFSAGDATNGFIQVDSFSAKEGGKLTGSFDLTFGSSDRVTGSLDATFCNLTDFPANQTCAP